MFYKVERITSSKYTQSHCTVRSVRHAIIKYILPLLCSISYKELRLQNTLTPLANSELYACTFCQAPVAYTEQYRVAAHEEISHYSTDI